MGSLLRVVAGGNRNCRQYQNDEPDVGTVRVTPKKTVGAAERDESARRDWSERAATLPARRVVVIDESSTHLDMMPRYARTERGQRAFGKQRRNDGQNITLLAGLRLEGMSVAMVVEDAVNTAVFEAYIQQVLLPTLTPGDIVILDHLAVHKSKTVRALLHKHGCRPTSHQLRTLLPKSSNFCVVPVLKLSTLS